jgi:hypothetical protein
VKYRKCTSPSRLHDCVHASWRVKMFTLRGCFAFNLLKYVISSVTAVTRLTLSSRLHHPCYCHDHAPHLGCLIT